MAIRVAALRRFPVKSMAGEELGRVTVREDGLAGDRSVIAVDEGGDLLTARTRERLLGLRATLDPAGTVLVDGEPWNGTAAAALVEDAAGPGTRLEAAPGGHRWDDTPLLVTTDGAIAALGDELDPLRFRANIHLTGVDGLAERDWVGRDLRIGDAVIRVELTCERCKITTIDPETLAIDGDVLRRIKREFGGKTGLCCTVRRGGEIAVGDPAELVEV